MFDIKRPFRLNVGFIISENVGYSREFPLEFDRVALQDLELRSVRGSATFTRTTHGLLVEVDLLALTQTECVRCLEPFDQDLHTTFTELYAFSKNSVTDSNLILPESGKVDLEPLIREYMLLEIPIKPVCKPECKGLCPVCGENLNVSVCHHEEEEIDPRLSSLKSLLS